MSSPPIVRALSIRQPAAELILRGQKSVDYRRRKTALRERVYIYALPSPGEEAEFEKTGVRPELPTGVILGSIEITHCTGEDEDFEWHLANPERLNTPLKPKNQPQTGLWEPQF
jgi:hypothetical protein